MKVNLKRVYRPKEEDIWDDKGNFILTGESHEKWVSRKLSNIGYKVQRTNCKKDIGIPDFKIYHPNSVKYFYLEVKCAGHGLSYDQIQWLLSNSNEPVIILFVYDNKGFARTLLHDYELRQIITKRRLEDEFRLQDKNENVLDLKDLLEDKNNIQDFKSEKDV